MGNVREAGDEDGVNGAGAGYDVQYSHAVGVIIWERDLGGDGGHNESTRGIPSLGI